MMRPLMAAKPKPKLPETHRLRPRELFFIFLGATTGAGLGVFWFRFVPEALARKSLAVEALTGFDAVVTHLGFQIPVLVIGAVLLSAGIATRTSSGKDRATWILAAGSMLIFGTLLLSVNVLYDPLLVEDGEAEAGEDEGSAPDDDWED